MDDPVILSRLQFALTVMFHYLFPPMTIGLGVLLVVMEGLWIKTNNDIYHQLAKFWTKIFGIIFALGVASGIVMEFQFGTNWATYSRYVGDIFGSALAAEGIFAFFLESGFLALLLFGWDKVGKKLHFFSTCMVSLGAHFSAIWIIVANSWMQTPAGYKIVQTAVGPRAEMTSFMDVVLNPSTVDRLTHTVAGAWLTGAALLLSVCAWYLLKGRFVDFAKKGMKVGLVVGMVAALAMGMTGDHSARGVAKEQPAKFAAMEGVFETSSNASFHLFGLIDPADKSFTGISVPSILSYLTFQRADAEIKGLDAIPETEQPPISPVFYSFHVMAYLGCAIGALLLLGIIGWWKGWLFSCRWLLWCFVFLVLVPQIANQLGWMVAELGRQPWIVYGVLKTQEAVSPTLNASQALFSLLMFCLIYVLLFSVFIYQMTHKITQGPYLVSEEEDDMGHGKQQIPFVD